MEQQNIITFILLMTVLIACLFISSEAHDRKTYLGEVYYGARSLALGGCMVADRDDIGSVFFNPAALALMTGDGKINFGFNKNSEIVDFNEEQVAIIFKKWGAIRAGMGWVSNSALIHEETGANLWYNRWATFGIGMQLSSNCAIGSNIQVTSSGIEIDDQKLDQKNKLMNIGVVYSGGKFSAGMAIHNAEIFKREKQIQPDYHFGFGYKHDLLNYRLEVSNFPPAISDQRQFALNMGLEVDFAPGLLFRIGTSIPKDSTSPSVAIGFGISLKNFIIDYVYTTPYHVQSTHKLSTTYVF